MEPQQIIPALMGRIKASADRAVRNVEENKDGDDGKAARGQTVEWIRDAIFILAEPLQKNEKVRAVSKVMDEVKNGDNEPQEMRENDKFGESVEGLCKGLITDVECIMHDNEAQRARVERKMEETAKSFEQCKQFML